LGVFGCIGLDSVAANAGVGEIGRVTGVCFRSPSGTRDLETYQGAGGFLVGTPSISRAYGNGGGVDGLRCNEGEKTRNEGEGGKRMHD